ncbi:TPA: HipA N-terminal domain-containing protein [Vibrio parahaemolyticus]|uniref:HipA N-terminal domain-containing protein n=1 Tax=Vibrio TaxID=662 RepID=UPI0011224998
MVRQLHVLIHSELVGLFAEERSNAHSFQYDEDWLNASKYRTILSCPQRREPNKGES